MKKFLFVSLIVLVLAAVAAQPAAAGFGLKGGLSQATLKFSPDQGIPLSRLNAPTGGVFWDFNLGLFSIQPEALYVRMGARMEEGADWLEDRFDYIQIPVLLKIKLLPGPIKPVIYAGGYYSFLLSAKEVANIGGVESSSDLKAELESSDYGLVFGGGIDFNLVAIKLSAEFRYNLGLANIGKNAGPGESVKNDVMMFLVGVGF